MAAMSTEDTTYLSQMDSLQQDAIVAAKTYLEAAPGSRRANITAQARDRVRVADACCCAGEGCACCGGGCCYGASCCSCKAGCSCGSAPKPTALATS